MMSNLSQDAIDALLRGDTVDMSNTGPSGELDVSQYLTDHDDWGISTDIENEILKRDKSSQYLTSQEIDTLGEIANICMGTSATTMYTLLGHRVTITTPRVNVFTSDEVLSIYRSPFVAVTVGYTEGVDGRDLLILKEYDTALITDLLMGGSGILDRDNIELNEIHLSAIGEIMNQMIGSSATALSNLLGKPVNISPPAAARISENTDVKEFLGGSELVIKISFDMEIESLLKSKLMQIMPLEEGKKLASDLLSHNAAQHSAAPAQAAPTPAPAKKQEERPVSSAPAAPAPEPKRATTIDVKPVSYPSFDTMSTERQNSLQDDFAFIRDIPLQVTVELGKTKKNINDIMNMGIGSIVVLDKMAGEMVDVIVNGKLIARGEVVVIDENYGVRITDIVRSQNSQ